MQFSVLPALKLIDSKYWFHDSSYSQDGWWGVGIAWLATCVLLWNLCMPMTVIYWAHTSFMSHGISSWCRAVCYMKAVGMTTAFRCSVCLRHMNWRSKLVRWLQRWHNSVQKLKYVLQCEEKRVSSDPFWWNDTHSSAVPHFLRIPPFTALRPYWGELFVVVLKECFERFVIL